MLTDWRKLRLPETPVADEAGKHEPIRPAGVSSRLPLMLLIVLLGALFIGYRSLVESAAWRAAETYFRQNQEVRDAVGEVRTCRPWLPVKIDMTDEAFLIQGTVRIEGTKADTKGHVLLKYESGTWQVVAAAYEDGQGRVRTLLRRDKPAVPKPAPGREPAASPAAKP